MGQSRIGNGAFNPEKFLLLEKKKSDSGPMIRMAIGDFALIAFAALAAVAALSGTVSFAQDNVATEPAVVLQRFIVTATPISKRPWQYASIPGVEILSRAANSKAVWWTGGLQRGFAVQEALMPEHLTAHFSTPFTLIIDDTPPAKAAMPTVAVPPTVVFRESTHIELMPVGVQIETFSSPAFSYDADTLAGQSNLYGVAALGAVTNEGWDLEYRLGRYAPAPPWWLRAGLWGRYGLMRHNVGGFLFETKNVGDSMLFEAQSYVGKGQFWITDEVTKKIQNGEFTDELILQKSWVGSVPDYVITLLPFGQLFSDTLPKPEVADLWACESTLFVRWALFGDQKNPARAAEFWSFVAGLSREPATEEFFRQCFGFGYDRLKVELLRYLPMATRDQPEVPAAHDVSDVSFRTATNDEVGRIIADWLRMKAEDLQGSDPSLARIYLLQAGKVLLRAYRGDLGMPTDSDSGADAADTAAAKRNNAAGVAVVMQPIVVSAARIHDPALLAVYGLYARDIGDDAKARELLEAAAKAGARRPAAFRELARLRYTDAAAHPAVPGGKFSAGQIAFAIEPLLRARQMTPADLSTYGLMAAIWLHAAAKPSAADLAFLTEALALFPKNATFAYDAASIYAKFGFAAEASRTIDGALPFATDDGVRGDLTRLKKELATTGPSTPACLQPGSQSH